MSDESKPLVTIITLVYNTGLYVIEALESVVKQAYPNIQHIIIDDCSTDNSVEIVSQWIDENDYSCEFLLHNENKGISKSLNDGLKRAIGKYITIIGDDLFLSHKLNNQVRIFESLNNEYGIVYSDVYMKNDYGDDLGTLFQNYKDFKIGPEGNVFEQLFLGNFIHGSGVLIRTECFKNVGYCNELLLVEDIDMYLRIALKYKFKFDDKISAIYRIHGKSFLQTIGTKGSEENLKSLEPYYNYSHKTFTYFISYLDGCLKRFYNEGYIHWKLWYKKRWRYKKDIKSLKFFLIATLNISSSKRNFLNNFFSFK